MVALGILKIVDNKIFHLIYALSHRHLLMAVITHQCAARLHCTPIRIMYYSQYSMQIFKWEKRTVHYIRTQAIS